MPVANTNTDSLITDNIDLWTSAIKKKSATGRGSSKKIELYGIKKLRELILELAVRGKLVPQNENDEPASELLKRIEEEKSQLVKEKKLKKPKILPTILDQDKPFDLPANWEWALLGTVCKKITDGSHNPPKNSGEGYPMLSSQNVNFDTIDFSSPSRFVTEEDYQKENKRTLIKPNDVLLNIVASIGRSAVVPKNSPKFVLQRSVAVLDSLLEPTYFAKQLVSPLCLNYYNTHAKGTAQKGIYLGKLSLMPLAVPPLTEQHRIVAKVDELMSLCDQLESQTENNIEAHKTLVGVLLATLTDAKDASELDQNWQRLSEHFEALFITEDSINQLKQTILQLAVMGKLVPQDPNDEPASVLLDKIAAEKEQLIKDKKIKKQKPLPPISEEEKPFELPSGWEFERLGNLTSRLGSGSTPRGGQSAYVNMGIIFLRSQNIWNDGLKLHDTAYISDETHNRMENTHVYPKDVLLNITGASLGRSIIFPEKLITANVSQHVTIIRLIETEMCRFLHLGIQSPLVQKIVWARQVGMAIEGLSKKVLEQFEFPVPPVSEQQRIVNKVDQLMAICDELKFLINDSHLTQLHLTDTVIEQVVN